MSLVVIEEQSDTLAPEVSGVSPEAGTSNVEVDAEVVIRFSETISPSTLVFSCMPDPGGWSLAWEQDDQVVRMSHLPFAYNTQVTLTVLEAQDGAGNELVPYSWSFTSVMKVERVYLPLVRRHNV